MTGGRHLRRHGGRFDPAHAYSVTKMESPTTSIRGEIESWLVGIIESVK